MPCYHPLRAFQLKPGAPLFFGIGGRGKAVQVACGKCIGCRLEYSRQWAVRCVHESRMHEQNSFLTLTYDEAHLPADLSLRPRDMTLFWKRLRELLRKACRPQIRYFMCGEYGAIGSRPHYHAIVFGFYPEDAVFYRTGKAGHKVYTSKCLDEVWGQGSVFVGNVTNESAAYVARYVVKKVNGAEPLQILDVTTGELIYRVKEYSRSSNHGGIGRRFLDKFPDDVFSHDRVVVDGKEGPVPRYYNKVLQVKDPDLYELNRDARMARGEKRQVELEEKWRLEGGNPFADVRRLGVHEAVKQAQVKQFNRS